MKPTSAPLVHSLRFQITAAILVMLVLLIINTAFSFYSEGERRQDYIALQSSGNIQQLIHTLITGSTQYAQVAPRDWETYFRDIEMYGRALKDTLSGLDKAITSLDQFPDVRQQWSQFSTEIAKAIGDDPDQPKLEAAANWVIAHQDALTNLSVTINQQTQSLLNQQLATQRSINFSLLFISLLITLTTLIALHHLFGRPLQNILTRLQSLAQGEAPLTQSVTNRNEMGTIFSAIDDLTRNLKTTFNLTKNINQATNIDSALSFVFEEYKQRLPVDTLCLIHISPDGEGLILDRIHSDHQLSLKENSFYSKQHCELTVLQQDLNPLLWQEHEDWASKSSSLVQAIQKAGLQSALFFPFNNQSGSILLFASSQPEAFSEEHLQLLKNAGGQLQHAFEKTELVENLVISAVSGLSKLAESRDPETGDHLDRMSQYSMILAEELSQSSPYQHQIDNRYIRDILRFAPMHDIGKVGIADSILLKPGRLDDKERSDMELHPAIGGEVLRRCEEQLNASGHSMFTLGIEIAEGHHEKWNGSGYPHGWKAEEIPLSARIVAVADVFDALTSKRPYKDAWPVEKALNLLTEESGKHFDPEVVAAFQRSLPRILQVYERLKHV